MLFLSSLYLMMVMTILFIFEGMTNAFMRPQDTMEKPIPFFTSPKPSSRPEMSKSNSTTLWQSTPANVSTGKNFAINEWKDLNVVDGRSTQVVANRNPGKAYQFAMLKRF